MSLVPTSRPMQAVGVRIDDGEDRLTFGVKLDLDAEIARENIRPRYQYDLGRTTYGGAETDAHFFTLRESEWRGPGLGSERPEIRVRGQRR